MQASTADNGPIQVIAHENSQLSCQMWSFNDKLEQSEHTQIYSDDHKWVEYRNAELGKQLQKAHTMNAGFSAELAAEMKKLMEKHSNDMENLKEEMAKAISAKEEALQKELEAERTKMQKQMIKLEEQKKALADGLTAAREGADRKLHEQAADFDRRIKETEESAQEEQKKLIAELDKMLSEKAAADTKLKDSEKMARAQTRQKLQHIRSLLDAAQKEKEAAYRKHLDLLRSVRAQVSVFRAHLNRIDLP
jgi:DNA repair exonuclease SbcCD ATPase subunit